LDNYNKPGTRIVLRVIAITQLLGAFFLVLLGVRELVIVHVGAYGPSVLRTTLSLGLGLLGLLGSVGSFRLANYSNVGRRLTLLYLTLLMPLFLILPVSLPLLVIILSVCFLLTPAARRACGMSATKVIA